MVSHTKTAEMILKSITWLSTLEVGDCQNQQTYCCCPRCVAVGELYRAWRSELGPIEFPARKAP